MIRFVLDTDVIIAAMRSPSGASAALLGLIMEKEWEYRPEELPTLQPPRMPLAACAILYSYEGICLVLPVEDYKIGLPRGVIEGQELYELLVDLTAPVHSVNDFDSLPRPFRCARRRSGLR